MFRFVVLAALLALASAFPFISDRPQLDGRIVGGEDTDIRNHPHQISLQWNGRHNCGGSIISKKYVFTAGHCVQSASASSLSIRAGTSNRGQGGVEVKVARIIGHSKYNSWNIDYDFALLELAEELEFSAEIQPIEIATSAPAPGTPAVVTGWGAVQEGGASASVLQEVRVPIVSIEECRASYGQAKITDRMICAGIQQGGQDACQGDSGGPLIAEGKLVGVVSWGYGCARPGYPGVYSNVASVVSWVQNNSDLGK